MDALTEIYMLKTRRTAAIKERGSSAGKRMPRRCMVVSVGLILAGLSIPALMVLHLLPVTFWLAFVGIALAESGGVMALILCGEL
jgi:hypothetical protein